jgi:hypothetical protein
LKRLKNAEPGAKASKRRTTREVEVRFQTNTTAGLRLPLSPPPQQRQRQQASPPLLTVHFAKNASNETLIPSPSSKICTCNLPSHQPSQKKKPNETIQISQCKNSNCRYIWYHYHCLDKSEKIKSRHGSFLCRWCRNEVVFCGLDREEKGEGEGKGEKRWRWSREEIEERFPGLGGVEGIVRPYGLGGGVVDVDGDGE